MPAKLTLLVLLTAISFVTMPAEAVLTVQSLFESDVANDSNPPRAPTIGISGGATEQIIAVSDFLMNDFMISDTNFHLETSLTGIGTAAYGSLAGRVNGQAISTPGVFFNSYPAKVEGQLRLGFEETAVVFSPTLAAGQPVNLPFVATLAAAATVTGNPVFTANKAAGAHLDVRVTDLGTGQTRAPFLAVTNNFVGPPSFSFSLPTTVGSTLRLSAELRLVLKALADQSMAPDTTVTGAVLADHTAHLFYEPIGDIQLMSESGHDYLMPAPLAGDYNENDVIDAADYTVWRDTLGSTTELAADGDGSGTIDNADYDIWKTNFGETAGSGSVGVADSLTAVPEPTSFLLALALVGVYMRTPRCDRNC